MNARELRRLVRLYRLWLREGKPWFRGIGAVLLAATAAVALSLYWPTETPFRIVGYLLQLCGILVAVGGLLRIRTVHFDKGSMWTVFVAWWERRPKWASPEERKAASGGSSAPVTLREEGEGWLPDYPERPVEERIEALVNNQNRLSANLRSLRRVVTQLESGFGEFKNKSADELSNLEERQEKRLESLHLSDFATSLVGLGLLTAGITFSTLAPELACAARWLFGEV